MRSLVAVSCAWVLGFFLVGALSGCSDTGGIGGAGGVVGTGGTSGGGGSGRVAGTGGLSGDGGSGGVAGTGGVGGFAASGGTGGMDGAEGSAGAGGYAGSGGNGGGSGAACAESRAAALRVCVRAANDARRSCYAETGSPCSKDDSDLAAALGTLENGVRDACMDGDIGRLTVNAWVARLQTACLSETQSIASRAFGGPHGSAWARADALADDCLLEPHRLVSSLIDSTLEGRDDCLRSDVCDAVALQANESARADVVGADILAVCEYLPLFVAIEPHEYVSRTMAQADCLTAIAHDDTEPLGLRCGPSVVTRDPPPAPGADGYMRIVLDSETYGTRCGGDDSEFPGGNPYAFLIKLAPPGHPIEKVLIYLEGGGACMFGEDDTGTEDHAGCYGRYLTEPELFEALDNEPYIYGIMSDDPAVSPFANWTKVFVPYCTQDLHMGNGVTSPYEIIRNNQVFIFNVHRYGAINTRTALRYVRDLLWRELDSQGGDGFRPDRITAAFAGFSAGGWGALYNYHWVLDDLQWPHTAAFPDSALALDNIHHGFWSLRFLANYVVAGVEPYNWAAQANQPPYCFGPDCAVGPDLLAATAPRLKAVPEQQYMIISNQNDEGGQMRSTFFDRGRSLEEGRINWINAARQGYCDTKDLKGIHYFLMPFTESLHSTTMTDYYLSQPAVDGQTMNDWMADAFSNPDQVADRTEEGDLTTVYPGVNTFESFLVRDTETPCEP